MLASKIALDVILGGADVVDGRLLGALLLLAGSTAVSTSIAAIQQLQQRLLSERVDQVVWNRILDATLSVDLMTWQSTAFMDWLNRIRTSAVQRPLLVVSSLFGLIGSAVGVTGMMVALLALQPLLIPLLVAAGIPAVLLSRSASRREFAFAILATGVQRRRFYLKRLMTERTNAAEIRAFDAGAYLLRRHAAENRAYLNDLRRHVRARRILALAATGSAALALVLTLSLIVLLVNAGRMSLAEAGAAVIAARLLGGQLTTLFSSVGTLIESGPFLADLDRFVVELKRDSAPGRPRALLTELRADNVSFRYDEANSLAVDGVNIVISARQSHCGGG